MLLDLASVINHGGVVTFDVRFDTAHTCCNTTPGVAMQLLVMGMRGRRLTLHMSPRDRIRDVIAAVAELDGVRVQCLMVGGMPLRADRTLADCNLASGVVLHAVLSVRGG